MDAIFRRSYGRIPGIAVLFVLSILFISSPVSGVDTPSQLYRRDVQDRGLVRGHGLVWRQEPPASTTSSATTTNSTFATPSSNSTTISSTTQTSSSTSSVSTTTTITTTSTSTRSVSSTSTSTSISTTSISSSESSSSTSTSVVPVLTVTRTRARATTSSEPTPETTLIASDNFLPTFTTTHTSTQGGSSSTVTPLAVGATSKGFWANKAAVAAVFVIVSLVVLGVGALLIVNFLKRRNTARQRLLHSRLFEKYSDSPSPKGSVRGGRPDVVYDDSRFTGAKVTSEYPFAGSASNAVASSSGAAAAATAPAPQQQQQQYQYQAPPSSSHGSQQTAFYTPNASQQSLSTHDQHNAAAFSTNPAPLSAVATTQRTHYMLPSQSQAAAVSHYTTTSRLAPPVAYRDPTQADRTSYQHSIDSFYGGNQR